METLEAFHLRGRAVYTVGQLEKGETGTLHLQFYMNFKDAKTLGGLKKITSRAHWEAVRNKVASQAYVMKEETRVEGPWEFGVKPL